MTIHINLMLACDLEPDTPEDVIEALEYTTNIQKYSYEEVMYLLMGNPLQTILVSIAHDLRSQFADGNYDLARYHGIGMLEFHKDNWSIGIYKLTIRCDGGAHHEFLETYFPFLVWLANYIDINEAGTFMGYYTRTNSKDDPTLIYFRDKQVYFNEITQEPTKVNADNVWDFI